jgi:hypothetical protein
MEERKELRKNGSPPPPVPDDFDCMSTKNTSTLCWAVIICAVLNVVSFFFLKCIDEKNWYGTLPFFYILPICNTVFVIAILVYGYFMQLLNNQRHEFDKTMEERKELRRK